MNQQEYWKNKWKKREIKTANNFAKRCFSQIKDKNFKTLLDLGCGDGRDALYFAGKGLNVTAIDFSQSGIDYLNAKIKESKLENLTAIQKNIKNIHFLENSYDIIYAHLSLHYFDDETTTKIFNKLYRLLRNGGLLFVKCKSTDDSLYEKGMKVGEDIYLKDHLRHFYSKKYMQLKLEKFKTLKIRKTSSIYHSYKSAFIEALATK